MKIIRWWGLVVFVVLLVLLALSFYLLAPKLIASGIQDFGSEAVGAKVEVGEVELSMAPLAVTINQLQVANPDAPMENLFESSQIKFSVDSEALLWKKLIIDELVFTGAKTGTPRKTSGELVGGRKTSQAISQVVDIEIPQLGEEDVKKLVEQADLITLKRVAKFKESQKNISAEWNSALDKEAFDARVEKIKAEYQRLSKRAKDNKLNLLKDKSDWKQLKRSISEEREKLASLSDKLSQDKKQLSEQLSQVKQGPRDDVNAVMSRFGLGSGVEGLVDKYLGPKYTPWVMRAIEMVESVKTDSKPVEETEKVSVQVGEKFYFTDKQVFPELLIKKVTLGGSNQGWELDGKGFDLGYLPWLTGQPAKLNLSLGGKGNAMLDIVSDWPKADTMSTKVISKVDKWPLESMQLMQTEAGNWLIESGVLTADIQGEMTLEKIDLKANFSVLSPKLKTPDSLTGWKKSLSQSISQQSKIDFQLTAAGSLSKPEIRLKSSLENLFKDAIGEQVKQKAEALKGKVQASISDKVGDLSALEDYQKQFEEWQGAVANKDDILKDLLGDIKF